MTRAARLWPLALLAAPVVLAQVAGGGAAKLLFRDIRGEAGRVPAPLRPEKKYIVESMGAVSRCWTSITTGRSTSTSWTR